MPKRVSTNKKWFLTPIQEIPPEESNAPEHAGPPEHSNAPSGVPKYITDLENVTYSGCLVVTDEADVPPDGENYLVCVEGNGFWEDGPPEDVAVITDGRVVEDLLNERYERDRSIEEWEDVFWAKV